MAYRKSLDFLPSVFQTRTNDKILRSTLDQLISEPEIKRVDGYIGRKFNPALTPDDNYIVEDFVERQNYQLEPTVVYNDDDGNTKFVSGYTDLLNRINSLGGIVNNHDRLFNADQYSYSSFFDFDKFNNYNNYYWLPNGPDSVNVFANEIPTDLDIDVTIPEIYSVVDGQFDVGGIDTNGFDVNPNNVARLSKTGYKFSYTGDVSNPVIRLARGGTYRFNVDQDGHGLFIQTSPGLNTEYPWQKNISIREVYGVENNGADTGTITFNVPTKNEQDFFATMPIKESVNLIAYSTKKRRKLKYTEVQNKNYVEFLREYDGIDGQRSLTGKKVLFLPPLSDTRVPQPWVADKDFFEDDLIYYANTVYRVVTNTRTGRTFSDFNLEVYDLGNNWYDPALYDSSSVGFDSESFDRGEDIPLESQLGWFLIDVDSEGIIRLTAIDSIEVNNKVTIGEGIEFSNREVYRTISDKLELLPVITANLDRLYYQDSIDPNIVGVIELVDQENNLKIDVNDIIGESEYTSPNGVVFENGLKVRFSGNITPSVYANKTYYIEGVGESIDLVDEKFMITPEKWLETTSSPYDESPFDSLSFDESQPAPKEKQYITIKRNSQEGSTWTRQNRWFHESVLENTAKYNKYTTIFDQNQRAKRPIVEFDANLQLFNFGKTLKSVVSVIDTTEVDALSNVEGKPVESYESVVSGYYSDGIPLVNGSYIIFANDNNEDVRKTVWLVKWISPESEDNVKTQVLISDGQKTEYDLSFVVTDTIRFSVNVNGVPADDLGYNWVINQDVLTFVSPVPAGESISVTYNPSQQIHLEKVFTASADDVVLVTLGTVNQGTNWTFNGSQWEKCQEKNTRNQAPLFDLFDESGISIANSSAYNSSSFAGSKLFGYKIGSGLKDTELDLRLSYRSINNVGDIVFVDYLSADEFSYESSLDFIVTESTNKFRARKNKKDGSYALLNQWSKTKEKSKQYQTQTFFATEFQTNLFRLNIQPESLGPEYIIVYKNNVALTQTQFDVQITNNVAFLLLDKDCANGDKIDVKVYSKNFNNLSNWEVPSNLENNALNDSISEITLGQLRNHILETFIKTSEFRGNYQGKNNSKDLAKVKANGGKILQNAGAPHLANLFLNDSKSNFTESLLMAQREYVSFKNKFLQLTSTYPLSDILDPVRSVDEVLSEICANKNNLFPYFYSDMVPFGNDYNLIKYEITNSDIATYYISEVYNTETANNKAVIVYLNGKQLVRGLDYEFISGSPLIELNIAPERPEFNKYYLDFKDGDILEIREYNTTNGSHVPPTPSKLGLYPSYMPEIIHDGYEGKYKKVIRGHDGSLTLAFGDYRDEIILELEKRIFNNIKKHYSRKLMDIHSYIPGAFRDTDYSKNEFDAVISSNFSSWLGKTNLQLQSYTNLDINDPFTWNYIDFLEALSAQKMPAGYWRGIYNYFYDTDQPHIRPWEMLGFTNEPDWWKEQYGPAPYTNGNKILWDDIEAGFVRKGERAGYQNNFKRPGLSKIIPVDDSGELLPPSKFLVFSNSKDLYKSWRFGDGSPVESVWRQSSEYPFAIQLALALTKPAEYFGVMRDTFAQVSKTFDNEENRQWVFKDTNQRQKTEYVTGEIVNNEVTLTSGYTAWIAEYAKYLSVDISEEVGKKLRNLSLNLSYKVGGYTDKKYIKLYADQSSPNSKNSSIVIPDEDFVIKTVKSSPRVSVTYSGVILTRTAFGFSVTGYDSTKPYFVIEAGLRNGSTRIIKAGNEVVEVETTGSGRFSLVPYGTELTSKDEVVNFLISYGRYLERQGFKFDKKVSIDGEFYHNWDLAAKEFLTWLQQGWEEDIVLSLSPIGEEIKFRSIRGAVDAISNRPYGSRILSNNFDIIDSSNYNVNRDGRSFSLQTTNGQAIYLADIDVVDYEHVIVLNNVTKFNDIIYQPETGSRQYRIKMAGFKTSAWDGTFGAPGFIINDNNIKKWQSNKNYYKGEIVRFKEKYYVALSNISGSVDFENQNWTETEYDKINSTLLPNLANKAGQSKSFYDFNKSNLELDADRLGKGIIGFSPREYLNDLGISDTSQVKFYQGLIRQKGSNNSLDKMLRANLDRFNGSAEFFEQWAIRDGNYSGTGITTQTRIPLSLSVETIKNPIVVEILGNNDTQTPGIYSVKEKDLLTYQRPFNKDMFANRSIKEKVNDLPTAGFVKADEVDYSAPSLTSMSLYIDRDITDGSRVWVAENEIGKWDVFRFTDTKINVKSVRVDANGTAVVKTTTPHKLKAENNNGIYVKLFPNNSFNNYYEILKVIDDTTFTVLTTFTTQAETLVTGKLYRLLSLKKNNVNEIHDAFLEQNWIDGDQFYLENATDIGWGVYERNEKYKSVSRYFDSTPNANDNLGVSLSVSRNNKFMVAGSSNQNLIKIYTTLNSNNLVEDNDIESPSLGIVDFGEVLSVSSSGFIAVGSPTSELSTGFVHIVKQDPRGFFLIAQALAAETLDINGNYGSSVSISDDGKWLYIGQPNTGNGKVWIYQLIDNKSDVTENFAVNSLNQTYQLTTDSDIVKNIYSLKVIYKGNLLIPFRDYTYEELTKQITFTNSLDDGEVISIAFDDYYDFVGVISADSSVEQFGFSVTSSTDGIQVAIGAPKTDSSFIDSGKVFVYTRIVENMYTDSTVNEYNTVTDFYGKTIVKVNGIELSESDYTIDALTKTVTLLSPSNGDILSIETNTFILTQELVDFESQETAAQFGYSIDLCPTNCSLYVGAPYKDDISIDSGKVHRFVNQGRFFGKVVGNVINPVISTTSIISINNWLVEFTTGEELIDIVIKINDKNIPGVTALLIDDVLTIETDRNIFADKLNLALLSGNFFDDVGLDVYTSQQVIESPKKKDFNNFGKIVKISNDSTTLVVATDVGDTYLSTTFDNAETTFDNRTTSYGSERERSGAVYVYELIVNPNSNVTQPSEFIFAQSLYASDVDELDRFGASIAISNDTIYVGAPGHDLGENNAGVVYGFKNPTKEKVWKLIRSEDNKVDLSLVNSVYLYNKRTREKIVDFDIIDPAKGKVNGRAQQEITYQTGYDPSLYNNANNTSQGIIWGEEHVGEIWWNTRLTKWTEYEQDSIEYRAVNWGFSFPESRVVCMEWTESDVPPESYNDPENPGAYVVSTRNFNVFSIYNEETKKFTVKYYYWVAGKTKVPENTPNRTISAVQIEELIANPKLNNVPYVAFLKSNAIAIYNVSNYVDNDLVIVVDYDVKINDRVIHSEYKILSDGDKSSVATDRFITKLIDSLAGEDRAGNRVPSLELNEFERLGIGYRPRQTMFTDRVEALREATSFINKFLLTIPSVYSKDLSNIVESTPLPEQYEYSRDLDEYIKQYDEEVNYLYEIDYINEALLPSGYKILVKTDETTKNRWVIYEKNHEGKWLKTRVQTYNNIRYINYATWTDLEISVPEVIENVVNFEYEIQSLDLREGEFVKIKDNGRGLFKVVMREDNTWRTVQEQNGTIQINEGLWNTAFNLQGWDFDGFGLQLFDDQPGAEIQNILRGVYNDVFTEEHTVIKNQFAIHMIKFALIQSPENDWAFKTSLIKVIQTQRAMNQIPVYQPYNQDLIEDYINEVKPYHTKISEFITQYENLDNASLNTTDFDLPAYYNSITGTYRSPTGLTVEDDFILDLEPYVNWKNNYTLGLDSIEIYYSGSDYFVPPQLNIAGGGGSGAKAEAVVANGKIINVIVTDPGSGYISTPTIEINQQSNDPAILSARMINKKVRNINTTIKFDRVSTPAGWLVEFKNSSGSPVDVRNEKISRISDSHGVIDEVLNLLSNGNWLVDSEFKNIFPVDGVPNFKIFNDTSGRVQFFERRDTRGWEPKFLEIAIRELGNQVGVNNVDLSGTTVTLDGSYASFMSIVLPWVSSKEYYQNDYIAYNSVLYKATQQFVAGDNFTSENLIEVSAAELSNHLDRVHALYSPKDNMLGNDLAQLFAGTVFPGVNLKGADFNVNPGFDSASYDISSFDSSIVGEEGVPIIDPSLLDQEIYSKFEDIELGTRPEDIIVDGGRFVDQYHSHAPEEMIPGQMFDALDLRVYTLPSDAQSQDVKFGLDWNLLNYKTDGVKTRFKYEFNGHEGDFVMVYLKNQGPCYRDIAESGQDVSANVIPGSYYDVSRQRSYSIDYKNSEIIFNKAPAEDDILQIYNLKAQGESIIVNEHFTGSNDQLTYPFIANSALIANSMVLVNGVETSEYIIYANPTDTATSVIAFNSPLNDGDHVHLLASSNLNKDTISKPYTQIKEVNNTNRTVVLDETLRYGASKDTVVMVELNGDRLRPGNSNYYIGDGTTDEFALPTSANEDYSSIVNSQVVVWVNDIRKFGSEFEILGITDPAQTPRIKLNDAPIEGSRVSVTYRIGAEYFYSSADNTIRVSESVDIPDGSLLAVTSFSAHDVFDIKTKVFIGTDQLITNLTYDPGFGELSFDSLPFDGLNTTTIFDKVYQIEENQNRASRIIVTVDGKKLIPIREYIVRNGELRIAESIEIDQETVITVMWTDINKPIQATSFQVFKGMDETVSYNRISIEDATVLARDLLIRDKEIVVVDGSKLSNPSPDLGIPGVIFINGERITYYQKDQNVLSQIRRGTNGTGAAMKHESGTYVVDTGQKTIIPGGGDVVWYDLGSNSNISNGLGLQQSTTAQALFLLDKKGFAIPKSTFVPDVVTFIEEGYIEVGYVE